MQASKQEREREREREREPREAASSSPSLLEKQEEAGAQPIGAQPPRAHERSCQPIARGHQGRSGCGRRRLFAVFIARQIVVLVDTDVLKMMGAC